MAALNTGSFNSACALIGHTLERDFLYLACKHHMCELVFTSISDGKIDNYEFSCTDF